MSAHLLEPGQRPRRLRYVTLCQQLLVLAVVVAVLTPAARTVTMEVRPAQPTDVAPADVSLKAADFPSEVPTGEVEADEAQYALTAPTGQTAADADVQASTKTTKGGGEAITSEVVPVTGYGTVGVTWSEDERVGDDEIDVQVRTRTGDEWSDWTAAEYHDEHGPDPSTREGRNARPGTDALLVGEVDAVQVKVATDDAAPVDMKLSVIEPGTPEATTTQTPAIDTADFKTMAATVNLAADGDGDVEPTPEEPGEGDIDLQAGVVTPKPMIYSRAQWGANESLRDKPSLRYSQVNGGFVHHTVNANNYTADQVPGIIRSIYAYHVRTRGWSDIGYNFLVDRFGRIWEGRYGGVDRPVTGAHTQGYNGYAFAASAIGNFDTTQPTSAMLNAYGALFAWKLALHGVSASSTAQRIGTKTFPAISGHRDAGSTACPGRYLYAEIPQIRKLAAAAQKGWSGRDIDGDYVGDETSDLLVRRATDGRMFTIALGTVNGVWTVKGRTDSGVSLKGMSGLYKAGDWDGDGHNDVIARRARDGKLFLYRGLGAGKFANAVLLSNLMANVNLLVMPGDVTGDGNPDMMGQPVGGVMRIYPGKGAAGLGTATHNFWTSYPAYSAVKGQSQIPAGLLNLDGAPDTMVRNGDRMTIYYGNGPGGISSARVADVSVRGWDWIVGMGRLGSNRTPDYIGRIRSNNQLYIFSGTSTGWSTRIPMGNFTGYDLAA